MYACRLLLALLSVNNQVDIGNLKAYNISHRFIYLIYDILIGEF